MHSCAPAGLFCPRMRTTYIAFLRAVNVGGRVVKMQPLRTLFEELGLNDVRTFLQSGNVAFTTGRTDRTRLTKRIERHLAQALGYDVPVMVRTIAEVDAALGVDPFKDIKVTPDVRFFVLFLSEPVAGRSEACRWHAPEAGLFHSRLHERRSIRRDAAPGRSPWQSGRVSRKDIRRQRDVAFLPYPCEDPERCEVVGVAGLDRFGRHWDLGRGLIGILAIEPSCERLSSALWLPRGALPERPMATACFRLVTFFPELPERNVPRFCSCITLATFRAAAFPYRRLEAFFAAMSTPSAMVMPR